MTTWKGGGDCGRIYREIVNEDESHVIAKVRIRRDGSYRAAIFDTIPWPKGEANFRLILKAPQMLEALEAIRDQAECYLQPLRAVGASRARWEKVRDRAVAAIAAVKGEDDDKPRGA